jgi:hypothetical protein
MVFLRYAGICLLDMSIGIYWYGFFAVYWIKCLELYGVIMGYIGFGYTGSTADYSDLISLLATCKVGFTSRSRKRSKTVVLCPKMKNCPNHSKSTCRIGPFCWNMWLTEALSLLLASSKIHMAEYVYTYIYKWPFIHIIQLLSSKIEKQPFDFQSVAWVLNRSQIHNPGVYPFQSH